MPTANARQPAERNEPDDGLARRAPGGAGARTLTAADLADRLGAALEGPGETPIRQIDPIEHARAGSLTFVRDAKRAKLWPGCAAGAVIVTESVALERGDPEKAILRVPDADLALIRVLELFAIESEASPPGVDPSAIVDPSAEVDPSACIGPLCVVGPRARIGPGAVLVARVTIGADVRIDGHARCHAGVVIHDRCRVGEHAILHSNVVLGTDGFGYRPSPDGRGLVKIPHIGSVDIGPHVEIGAGTCVDRGKLGDTSVGAGTKIDNLVQIGHNCRIGRACVICGHVAIGGSAVLGDGCQVGGGSRIADNLTLAPGTRLAGGSALMNNTGPGETWLGVPAGKAPLAAANLAAQRHLADTQRKVRKIAKKLGL